MKVVVGLSGGVDSAVASAILVEEGHEVIGANLRFHREGKTDERSALVAEGLGIRLLVIPAEDDFEKKVLEPFFAAYRDGLTPNPCVICNELVKFATLFSAAEKMGAHAVATGHYARIAPGPGGAESLFRASDPSKDQSYMLYRILREKFSKLLFPLGCLTKTIVRERSHSLFPGLFKGVPESKDLCFISGSQLGAVIQKNAGPFPGGKIVTVSGECIGCHSGLHRYTIGQRKGLALSGGPWFVSGKDFETSELIVGGKENLRVSKVFCTQAIWHENPVDGTTLSACHRYRSRPSKCVLGGIEETSFSCFLPEGVEGVAPGQSLVLYYNDRVYGGGIIERTE
ncbi:MAG: tRNA 2-thiouridine(34) synthase MnmA [Thermovirgaceae bacterium]|nr:tRNA 2-thiouridine(34) synthase MnmA [Thermovirgaceae bacterium]